MDKAARDALERLDQVVRRLRRDCPWDRAQDERSIVPHTVEETNELVGAVESGDDGAIREELGDLLFQVLFLALLLEERGAGDLNGVAAGLSEKLIRRHPHVFGDVEANTPEEAIEVWQRVKREERARAD